MSDCASSPRLCSRSKSKSKSTSPPRPHDTIPSIDGPAMSPPTPDQTQVDCVVCLEALPYDSMPVTGEYQPVARVIPCSHVVHNQCLRKWIERANTCPLCRALFNEVHVSPTITGPVLDSYPVEDRKQRVADDDSYVPRQAPELLPGEEVPPWYNNPDESSWRCEVCSEAGDLTHLLICDGCRHFYHTFCVGEETISHTSDWYCQRENCRSLAGQPLHRQMGNVRTADDLRWIMQADRERQQNAWNMAWQHLDADLIEEEDEAFFAQVQAHHNRGGNRRNQQQQQRRMSRRRAAAAAQTGDGPNAFEEMGWMHETTRPRVTNPHLVPEETKEEQDSWKLLAVSESIDKMQMEMENNNKRRRGSGAEERFAARLGVRLSPPPEQEGRKYKRPRTKRNPEITLLLQNRNNGESSAAGAAASASSPPPSEAASGGLFSSILEGIGKSAETPMITTAEFSPEQDLARMRPLSPDQMSMTSPMSRSHSPHRYTAMMSPSSPPYSRPQSPVEQIRGRPTFSPSSPSKPRTPAQSPARPGVGRAATTTATATSPTSPPISRDQSPNGQTAAAYARKRPRRNNSSASSSAEGSSSTSSAEASSDSEYNTQRAVVRLPLKAKESIVGMVTSALKPLYPDRISKAEYTHINQIVSRKMYKLVSDRGLNCTADGETTAAAAPGHENENENEDRAQLRRLVEQEVHAAVACL